MAGARNRQSGFFKRVIFLILGLIFAGIGTGAFSQEFPSRAVKIVCLLYTSPSPRDRQKSRMPSSA